MPPARPAVLQPPKKVLVVGDDARSFLAVVRSFGRRGLEVHAAPIIRSSLALASRYIAATHYLPYYEGDGERWLIAVKRLLDREDFALSIPLDDRSIIPFHRHRGEFEPRHRLALPSDEAFVVMFSKDRTRQLAESLGIPVARGRRTGSHETAASILAEFDFPLVLKPISSFSFGNLYAKSVVRTVATREQLDACLAREITRDGFVIESHFPGLGLGVSILSSSGRIVQAFEHHRVHEPPGGGGSSYRVSAAVQPPLLDACAKFVGALKYTGVAMFEFKQDPTTRSWILLEVNGRFWGSLPLAIAAGVDFPSLLFDLLVGGEDSSPRPYRSGIYSRSIGDDYWYYRFRISECRHRGSSIWRLIAELAREIGHVFKGVERIDTFALDDLRPAIYDVGRLASLPFNRLGRWMLRRSRLFRLIERRRIRRVWSRSTKSAPLNVVFVCKGNICRSPYAAAVARIVLPPNVACESVGILPMAGRQPPREAIDCARERGIDLSSHKSQILRDDMLTGNTLILTFDLENRQYLRSTYPAFRDRICLLGSYGTITERSCEITDPYGGSKEYFEETYDLIGRALDLLGRHIRHNRARVNYSLNGSA